METVQKRTEKASNEINEVLKKYSLALKPILEYTQEGVKPNAILVELEYPEEVKEKSE